MTATQIGIIVFIVVDVMLFIGLVALIWYCYTEFYRGKSNKICAINEKAGRFDLKGA